MSGKKGMKMYPLGIRENILIEHKNGVSQCELRRKYVINNKNGAIYNITIDIAKTNDGRTILYATSGKIKRVGNVQVNSLVKRGSGQNSNSGITITSPDENVNNNFSLSSPN